jgi:phenylalanyl-tRNA synthetase alpha chain
MQDILKLKEEALTAIEQAISIETLENIRVDFLGKKGRLTDLLKKLATLSPEERPRVGLWVNEAKDALNQAIELRLEDLKAARLAEKLASERVDVTLPGRSSRNGGLHPVTQIRRWINHYFSQLGFDIVEGPEIETEFYNFEALNIPAHHPARAMHDTFYFGDGQLLRTHTSPVQIRAMEGGAPPFRLVAPGRVYRCDSDMTHTPMFHQIEGLCIDNHANLASLKGLLHDLFSSLFERDVNVRFRASYFPFTEPSAEVDIQCTHCRGAGCRSCKFTGWLEVLGCGMVHPEVLKAVNISSDDYQGWAFGMGLDRLAMLYFGIDDLRTMFENDLAFLSQF